MDESGQTERLILSFSPLPQAAWDGDREAADDEHALWALRTWGDHLARAIRTADRLSARGWRLSLRSDLVVAEKRTHRDELEALARELADDLRLLTATAEDVSATSPGYLSLDGNGSLSDDDSGFRPLIDG